MTVAHFMGLASRYNDPWGSASLHPGLYAVAALRGLNTTRSSTCSELSSVCDLFEWQTMDSLRKSQTEVFATFSTSIICRALPTVRAATGRKRRRPIAVPPPKETLPARSHHR